MPWLQTKYQNGLKLHGNCTSPRVRKNLAHTTSLQGVFAGLWFDLVFPNHISCLSLGKLFPDLGMTLGHFAVNCFNFECHGQPGAPLQDSLFTYISKTVWMSALLTVLTVGLKGWVPPLHEPTTSIFGLIRNTLQDGNNRALKEQHQLSCS